MRKVVVVGLAALVGAGALTLPSMSASGADAEGPAYKFPPSLEAPWVLLGGASHGRDTTDAAVALCRTTASTSYEGPEFTYDVPRNGEVDAIMNDPIVASGTSNLGCTAAQNETTIAVNPLNPRNLVAGANDYRTPNVDGLNDGSGWAYYSFDGGVTWQNVPLPGLLEQTGGTGSFKKFGVSGDPVVTFGPDGVAYYANLVFNRSSNVSGIAVSRSDDGGRSWAPPSLVAISKTGNEGYDKEWIAAGPDGKVVVTWTRFDGVQAGARYVSSPIVAAFSNDGARTWERVGTVVSDPYRPYDQASQVAFGPDGSLYVSYIAAAPPSYVDDETAITRSTDFGRTWEPTGSLGRVYDNLDCYPLFNDRQTLTDMHFRINSYPSMAVDPLTGLVSVVWSDNEGSGTCGTGGTSFTGTTSNQVKLVQGTWPSFSAPRRITTGAADKVFPTVAARGGKVVVGYYTRGYVNTNPACYVRIPDGITEPLEVWERTTTSVCLDYAVRTLGNNNERRFTSQGSNPFVQFADGAFIGDYTAAAFGTDGRAYLAWTDFRGRPGVNAPNQDVYVSSFKP